MARVIACLVFGISMTFVALSVSVTRQVHHLLWPLELLEWLPLWAGLENPHNPFNLVPLLTFNALVYGLLLYGSLKLKDVLVGKR